MQVEGSAVTIAGEALAQASPVARKATFTRRARVSEVALGYGMLAPALLLLLVFVQARPGEGHAAAGAPVRAGGTGAACRVRAGRVTHPGAIHPVGDRRR